MKTIFHLQDRNRKVFFGVFSALMEAVNLTVVDVTKTTVTVVWAWQRKSEPIRVNRYTVTLRKDSETQSRLTEFSSEMCPSISLWVHSPV